MTRPTRIFLDANILFSAAKSDGAIRSLVSQLLEAGHECWGDGYVADEARRNLATKAATQLRVLDELIERVQVSTVAPVLDRVAAAGLPEKDQFVLAAAVMTKCDILVTGDRSHFGKFYGRTVAGVEIHSPRSLHDKLFPNR